MSERGMQYCPECGAEYGPEMAACPQCRVALADTPPLPPDAAPVVVHRVPDAVAGALLRGMLEMNGIPAIVRSASLSGYGKVARDWSSSPWDELLVPAAAADEARALIGDYLEALARGGPVRDEDVESE